MQLLISSFLLTLFITMALIRYQHLHSKFSHDFVLSEPQKFHAQIVPRIGGIGIYVSLIIIGSLSFFLYEKGNTLLKLSLCALPTFTIGLLEDLTKKISPKIRLSATALSALLFGYFFSSWINQVQIYAIDLFLGITVISIIFTVIAITGLANAYNIIDGFNGLASMVSIISLLAIGYTGLRVGDATVTSSCLICVGTIAGFFVWNYPKGLIFLGDGGAYLIGYLVATLSILVVLRNPTVSPWFAILVNAYPIFETLFTVWRRAIHQGKNPSQADGSHFHSLIYRRLIRWNSFHEEKKQTVNTKNSKTSPYLWILSMIAICPAIIWWYSTWILQLFTVTFIVFYIWIYKSIVKFKTPSFLKLLK